MIRRGGTFLQDNGGRRKPPSRALRPRNHPTSDGISNTLVRKDRGVFVCSSPLTQITSPQPDRNHVNHVNPVQHNGSVHREGPRHDRPKPVMRFFAPWRLCVR